MSAMAALTNSILNTFYSEYIAEFGETHDPEFIKSVIRPNFSYAHRFTPALMDKVEVFIESMNKLAAEDTPQVGHLLFTDRDSYNCCEQGILDYTYSFKEDGTIGVCKNGRCHVSGFNDNGASVSISGGHFFSVPKAELKPLDMVEKIYWIWGQNACGNGGINVPIMMKRWVY